jgi:hypothetical protein
VAIAHVTKAITVIRLVRMVSFLAHLSNCVCTEMFQEAPQASEYIGRVMGPHFQFLNLAAISLTEMSQHGTYPGEPTEADVAIADNIAAHTGRPTEHLAEALTWGADEQELCALYARTAMYRCAAQATMYC